MSNLLRYRQSKAYVLLIVAFDDPLVIIRHLTKYTENWLLKGLVDSNAFIRNGEEQLLLILVVENIYLHVFVWTGWFNSIQSKVNKDLLNSEWVTDHVVREDAAVFDLHVFYLLK